MNESAVRSRNAKAATAGQVRRLEDIPNIGPAHAADLRGLGLHTPDDVRCMDPKATYERLRTTAGALHDPCVLDVFLSPGRPKTKSGPLGGQRTTRSEGAWGLFLAAHDFMNGGQAQPWWRFTARRKRLLGVAAHVVMALGLTLLTGPGFAAQHRDSGSGCAVAAPLYLTNNDYSFQYQGACKAGLAEGSGKAIWTLRGSPQNRVVWEGAFSAGVYLPPPQGIVSARAWSGSDTVVFDLGALPAQNGVPAARLEVEAASDLTDYPDPCKPHVVWVVNAPTDALADDAVAQALLASAADKLKARCGKALSEQSRAGQERTHLTVRAVATPRLESDPWGNPGPEIASVRVPLAAGVAMQGYVNQAATQQHQQQQQALERGERRANARRLRAFIKTHRAQSWAALEDIAQNPFRFNDRVVVTVAYIGEVISPTRARVEMRSDGWRYAHAVLDGDGIAQWPSGPRLLAVRVTGRIKSDDYLDGQAQLQLLGSEACAEPRCDDWPRLPMPLSGEQTP
ncbi:MAG: helix-hairpin-helix domain-containing protein, partial [Burkholderiaceae bacterium]|nr:helix-hairpin-helix domain-containing protein [Burkholderiaceae bacterium]